MKNQQSMQEQYLAVIKQKIEDNMQIPAKVYTLFRFNVYSFSGVK